MEVKMSKRNRGIEESARLNNYTYQQYYNRLSELAINMYEWKNLPPTVDERFLELTLFSDGMAVFFKDPVLDYLCLQCKIGGNLDVYRIPFRRTAYATNGYNMPLTVNDSVIIFNNYLHIINHTFEETITYSVRFSYIITCPFNICNTTIFKLNCLN